jgi:hypothetical protein
MAPIHCFVRRQLQADSIDALQASHMGGSLEGLCGKHVKSASA